MGGMRLSEQGPAATRARSRTRVLAVLVVSAVAVGAVLVGSADTSGAASTTAPVFVSSSASPSTVHPGSTITFTWQVTSSIGVATSGLVVYGPDSTSFQSCFGPAALVAGTPYAGTYQQTCIVPKYVVDGKWSTIISMQDTQGQISYSGLLSFTVMGGTGGPPPPTIVSSSVSPSTVAAGSTVTVTWKVKSKTVVQSTGASMTGPNFSFLSNCYGSGVLIKGNPRTGTYQQSCVVPKFVTDGLWLTYLYVGNSSGTQVSVLGPTFTVTGGKPYVPPVVTRSSVKPAVVAPGGQVVFTWHVHANLGVSYTSAQAQVSSSVFTPGCFDNGVLVSGNAQNGTYKEVCSVPTTGSTGVWTSFISVQDSTNQGVGVPGPSFTVTAPVPVAAKHLGVHVSRAPRRAKA